MAFRFASGPGSASQRSRSSSGGAPRAAPSPASRGNSDRDERAPPARDAGRFAGAPRQTDEEYDFEADDDDDGYSDADEDEDPTELVILGHVPAALGGLQSFLEDVLSHYGHGSIVVKRRATQSTQLVLSFGTEPLSQLMKRDEVTQVVSRNGGKLLRRGAAWAALRTLGVDCNAAMRALEQGQDAWLARAAPRAARAAPAPAPAPAPPALPTMVVDVVAVQAAQGMLASRRLICTGCRGLVVFQLATQRMGVDAELEDSDDLPIAPGQPYLVCESFMRTQVAVGTVCPLRITEQNCTRLRHAIENARRR